MSFNTLGLSDSIVRAVAETGYTTPTPIQTQAIPAVLNGGDLLAGAQTGTGKTAGFTLPLLHRLSTDANGAKLTNTTSTRPIRALILTPTRELAAQVEESVRVYGKYTKLNSAVIFGGVSINPQIKQLRHGVDILVATPGRLLDHMAQNTIDLSKIEILVLDEADRMLDMGFIRDIRKVLAALPPKRQNLLFSATFSDEIKALADGLLNNPATIEVARRNSTVEIISQKIHPVDRDKKHQMLSHLIRTHKWTQVLVFTRTKHGANKLVEQLGGDGINGMAIHGNKSQSARTRALSEFKDGTLQVLVATDIAARGIDIDQLPHVVNYDLPNVPEDYVHRIGRTGRAGATGEAVSLVCVDEHVMLKDIEKLIKQTLPREVIPGFEPDPTAKPQPIQLRSGTGHHRNPRQGNGGGNRNAGGNGGNGQARANAGGGQGRAPGAANGNRNAGGQARAGSPNGNRSAGSQGRNGAPNGNRNGAPGGRSQGASNGPRHAPRGGQQQRTGGGER
ncbi:DEAD/DEAH box helicase [Pseudoduganella ginsengisoli]|uniref:ATP-dependent RNA helicase RhlE n=1 Tax=Pseudoduganella ginsengisoli TaxID=1462440 RepID=A0A6L6Q1K5_9BURK|nr:DEAD/DEAH box helicase [Pseudoduganella ginsengisoli]MTW03304.1 DEAD/DEAH box helicase [Pseudoduganella ginsengisoli]